SGSSPAGSACRRAARRRRAPAPGGSRPLRTAPRRGPHSPRRRTRAPPAGKRMPLASCDLPFADPPRGSLTGLPAGCDGLDPGLLQRRLGRREARERHAVRRAADVVEPQAVAEGDRVRLAAVLAADAELQVLLGAAAALDRDPHQVADAVLL